MSKKKETLSLSALRLSAAEIMAAAVLELFPGVLLVGGEVSDLGFYYDFIFPQPFRESYLKLIDEKLRSIVKEQRPIVVAEMMRDNIIQYFHDHGQEVRAEILEAVHDQVVEVFRMGDFIDVCPAPYLSDTKALSAFELQRFAEATIALPHGDEIKVTRLSGTAFHDKAALKKFLKTLEMAKKRDHRKLGRELELFGTHEAAGSGFWFWYPKGSTIRNMLVKWWEDEHAKQGYRWLNTPEIVKYSLLKEARFFDWPEGERTIFPSFDLEGREYVATPLKAPLHALAFKSGLHSYREFPIRYAEFSNIYYNYKSSQQRGMLKGRSYYADVAHVFCTPDQVGEEVISSLQFIDKTIKIFGFEYKFYLAARGRSYAGTQSQWKEYEGLFADALSSLGFDYEISEHPHAFFGPLVFVCFKDALGREWDGPQVGIDFNHPECLGLRYQGSDGDMHAPMMLTRAMFGSLERYIAILLEHYAGVFPLWLAPEQVRLLPVADQHLSYLEEVRKCCQDHGIRVTVDGRSEKLSTKVRAAQCDKVPYTLVIGDEEKQRKEVAVRAWNAREACKVPLDTFLGMVVEEVKSKKTMIRDPGA
ncbi:MAG: threonine--tRNA ligase [Chlamydiota bacterium]